MPINQHKLTSIADTAQPCFDSLPDSAFVREAQLVRSYRRPGVPAPLPFSAPTLWRMVKAGEFPAPVKLSRGITCWKVQSVREWMNSKA